MEWFSPAPEPARAIRQAVHDSSDEDIIIIIIIIIGGKGHGTARQLGHRHLHFLAPRGTSPRGAGARLGRTGHSRVRLDTFVSDIGGRVVTAEGADR